MHTPTKAELEEKLAKLASDNRELTTALTAVMQHRAAYLGFSIENTGGDSSLCEYFGVPGSDVLLVSCTVYKGGYTPYYSGLTHPREGMASHIRERWEQVRSKGWERGEVSRG